MTEERKTGLAIIPETNELDYSNAKVLGVIKATIAPDATNEEFAYFIALCQSTHLNPLKREIWFIKTKSYTNKRGETVDGKVQIMTGVNGFYAIANSYEEFDGIEIETTRDKDGRPIESCARAWRKDRKFPSTGRAIWAEDAGEEKSYSGKLTVWGQRPSVMLEKVAEARALRKAFPQQLSNLYLPEEFDASEREVVVKPAEKAAALDKILAEPVLVPEPQEQEQPKIEAKKKAVELNLQTADDLAFEQAQARGEV